MDVSSLSLVHNLWIDKSSRGLAVIDPIPKDAQISSGMSPTSASSCPLDHMESFVNAQKSVVSSILMFRAEMPYIGLSSLPGRFGSHSTTGVAVRSLSATDTAESESVGNPTRNLSGSPVQGGARDPVLAAAEEEEVADPFDLLMNEYHRGGNQTANSEAENDAIRTPDAANEALVEQEEEEEEEEEEVVVYADA